MNFTKRDEVFPFWKACFKNLNYYQLYKSNIVHCVCASFFYGKKLQRHIPMKNHCHVRISGRCPELLPRLLYWQPDGLNARADATDGRCSQGWFSNSVGLVEQCCHLPRIPLVKRGMDLKFRIKIWSIFRGKMPRNRGI